MKKLKDSYAVLVVFVGFLFSIIGFWGGTVSSAFGLSPMMLAKMLMDAFQRYKNDLRSVVPSSLQVRNDEVESYMANALLLNVWNN